MPAFVLGDYRVEVAPGALAKARRLARIRAPLETGGLLLGEVADGVARVLALTGPGRRAQRRRFDYDPDQEHDTRLVLRLWPRLTYLGDWHTHPGGPLCLSGLDVQAIRAGLSPKRHWTLHMLLAGDEAMREARAGVWTAFVEKDGADAMCAA